MMMASTNLVKSVIIAVKLVQMEDHTAVSPASTAAIKQISFG